MVFTEPFKKMPNVPGAGRGDSSFRRNSFGKEGENFDGGGAGRGSAWPAAGEPCQTHTQSLREELKTPSSDPLSKSVPRTRPMLLGEFTFEAGLVTAMRSPSLCAILQSSRWRGHYAQRWDG